MENEEVCRICRGPEESDEPLYHPCKCKGSIKNVHQTCLLEWLNSTNNYRTLQQKCELCKTEYVFKKTFRQAMPENLPLLSYARYAYKCAIKHSWVAFCFVRAIIMVFSISVITKYTLELMHECAEDSRCRLFAMQKIIIIQNQPRASHLQYIDYLLDFFIPKSDLRSAFVDGFALLMSVLIFFIVIWMMAAWVISDSSVAHDVEHIRKGQAAHIDRGDESIFDILDSTDNELVVPDYNAPRLAQFDNGFDYDEFSNRRDGERENPLHGEDVSSEHNETSGRNMHEENIVFPLRESFYEDDSDGTEDVVNNEDEFDEDDDRPNIFVVTKRLLGEIFCAPHYETLAGFLTVTAFIMMMCSIYSAFCGLMYRISHMCNVIGYMLIKFGSIENEKLIKLLSFLEIKPIKTVSGHICFIILNTTVITMVLRFLTLHSMKELLKSTNGKQWVETNFIIFIIVKTFVMTLTECLIFPQFCGTLMHLVMLPITGPWQWHYKQFVNHTYLTLFIHWLVGYVYMHALQVFVAACRKSFRKGVMFFLHDGDAMYFMRSIMIMPFPKQVRRFAASAGLYSGLIILGMFPVTVMLRLSHPQSWPLKVDYFSKISLLRLWPFVILSRFLFLPMIPSEKKLISILVLWLKERVWLRIFEVASRHLDLHSWLFATSKVIDEKTKQKLEAGDTSSGYFVRAPVDVPHRIKRDTILFVSVDHENRRLDGKKGVQPNELRKYTVVWRPPHFRLRIIAFVVMVLFFTSILTLSFTLVPLHLGRIMDTVMFNSEVKNDIVLYIVGLSVIVPIYVQLLRFFPVVELHQCRRFLDITGSVMPNYSKWSLALPIISVVLVEQPFWQYWKIFPEKQNLCVNYILPAVLLFCLGGLLNAKLITGSVLLECLLESYGAVPKSNLYLRMVVLGGSVIGALDAWKSSSTLSNLEKDVRESLYVSEIHLQNFEDEGN